MKLDGDRLRTWGVAALAVLALGCVFAFLTMDWWDHRLAPWPRGAVLRIDLPEDHSFLSPDFRVALLDEERRKLAVLCRGGQPGTSIAHVPTVIVIVEYPSGACLDRLVRPDASALASFEAARVATAERRFDFDGDGTTDLARCAGDGRAWVESGASGAVLWEQTDELEYEHHERLVPLGDLDGDGCSELAVLHPRSDRSDYDWEFFDLAFGATSWLTVVSGARATRR